MMVFFFWLLLGLIVYCYFGYPLLLSFLTFFKKQRVLKGEYEPSVSIIISVYNEEDVIEGKIENLLSLDYPSEKIDILIGSDGSTDKTNQLVESIKAPNVKLIAFENRRGKMAVLNELVKEVDSEIIVFADARQEFDQKAIKELVSNFADGLVGCVSGELIFRETKDSTAKGIGLYWKYEKCIRSKESHIHSMLGATGAIYAIRRTLFSPIPEHIVLDDMYVPLKIISQGYRAIYDDCAKAYDYAAKKSKEEYRRKVRTLAGNYQIFGLFLNAFNPATSPIAIQLFSHKFLRLMVPFCMIALFILNYFLLYEEIYKNIFFLQITFYTMAAVGGLARGQKYGILQAISRVCYVPYIFCLLNVSALMGFFRFVSSNQDVAWQKARE